MSILFFTKGDKTTGSSRQRVWFVADELKRRCGHEYEVVYGIRHTLFEFSRKRFSTLRTVYAKLRDLQYSIIFVHKSFFPWDVALLILLSKWMWRKKLVFDLDDAEWLHSPQKSYLLARYADVVLCGSHPILAWAGRYSKHAAFIPTAVDTELYGRYTVSHDAHDIITIGWVGQGKSHFKDGNFSIIQEVLIELSKNTKFRFVIIGSQNHEPLKNLFAGVPFEVVFVDEADWANPTAVPNLIKTYNFNVGVMPIVDSVFNRAKCAFKAVEYMACGVPTVSSPIGEVEYFMKHGENGFFAAKKTEWVSLLKELISDTDLRRRIGVAGQKTVEEGYSFQVTIPNMAKEIFLTK